MNFLSEIQEETKADTNLAKLTTILFKIITRMNFIIFELFRALQLQLSGVFRIKFSVAVTVSLFFLQNGVTGDNSPREFPTFSAITVT